MKDQTFLIFNSTDSVMKAKDALESAHIKCELIPKPVGAGTGCGVALKYDLAEEKKVSDLLRVRSSRPIGAFPFPFTKKDTATIYCDYNATTPIDQDVLEAMLPYYKTSYGNPSSVHSFGRDARRAVEEARLAVANLIGADEEEVFFTSGGTESNNLAIKGIVYASGRKNAHIITSSIEHQSVLNVLKKLEASGIRVTYVPVDRFGLIDPDNIERYITASTVLITVMHGNNETGTIEPISRIATVAKRHGIPFHTDAVQTIGKIPVDVKSMGVGLVSLSAHKIYGPKGIGALFIERGTEIAPLIQGGEQEHGIRAGTENVPAIAGLGKAAELASINLNENEKVRTLRDLLEREIMRKIKNAHINGHPENRLPNTSNISFGSCDAESLILGLDLDGIAASTGSACSSGRIEASHVLKAMGASDESARSAVRFSLGRRSTAYDVERIVDSLVKRAENQKR